MVKAIRSTELALGNGIKQPSPTEIMNSKAARKGLIAACEITVGETIEPSMLSSIRPATGLCPSLIHLVVGNKSSKHYYPGDPITPNP